MTHDQEAGRDSHAPALIWHPTARPVPMACLRLYTRSMFNEMGNRRM